MTTPTTTAPPADEVAALRRALAVVQGAHTAAREAALRGREREVALAAALAELFHAEGRNRATIRALAQRVEDVLDGADLDDGIVSVGALHRLDEAYEQYIRPLGPERMPPATPLPDEPRRLGEALLLAARAVLAYDVTLTDREMLEAITRMDRAAQALRGAGLAEAEQGGE